MAPQLTGPASPATTAMTLPAGQLYNSPPPVVGLVLVIKGVKGNANLSGFVDREAGVHIEAATGTRMDTCTFTLFDKYQELLIPEKAEIIIYDYNPATLPHGWVGFASNPTPIVDPIAANTTPLGYVYNSYSYDGVAQYDTVPPLVGNQNPSSWTPRMFAGYIATAEYTVTAALERNIVITCQDYTSRVNFTVCNRGYAPDGLHPAGWSDQQVVRDLFNVYTPDIDTTFVAQIQPPGTMPSISFPTHTLAQMMGRIIKISQGYFRVDYFKRLYYGQVGFQPAPFAINADAPNGMIGPSPSTGAEALRYSPDASNLIDRVWVVGGSYQGPTQTYTFPTTAWDGVGFTAVLPDRLHNARSVAIAINSVDQGQIGVLGIDGQLNNAASWTLKALVGVNPPTLAFQTPPPAGAIVTVAGIFTYPLIQIVADQPQIARLGVAWEKVIKDIRIDSLPQAQAVGLGYLALQKSAKPAGSCVIYDHAYAGQTLQPGQSIQITSAACFGGGVAAGNTLNAFITSTSTEYIQDQQQPYAVTVNFSDRPDVQDADLMDTILGEQARVNAALAQTDLNLIVEDNQLVYETVGFQAEVIAVTNVLTTGTYDSTAKYGFAKFS